jgi:hypothetical protein
VETNMVKKIVSELKDYDNVYYELCNEPEHGTRSNWYPIMVAAIRSVDANCLIAQNINKDSPVSGVQVLNFHYSSANDVTSNFSRNLPISFDENGFAGTGADTYRIEAWQFLLAGGAVYDGLDWTFEVGHEDGSGQDLSGIPSMNAIGFKSQMKILKDFMFSFDLANLVPGNSIITGGIPGGAYARALVKSGSQVAIHMVGGSQANLAVNLPANSYTAEWINTKTGAIDKTETFNHSSGSKTLVSPIYSQDIALRIKTSALPVTDARMHLQPQNSRDISNMQSAVYELNGRRVSNAITGQDSKALSGLRTGVYLVTTPGANKTPGNRIVIVR